MFVGSDQVVTRCQTFNLRVLSHQKMFLVNGGMEVPLMTILKISKQKLLIVELHFWLNQPLLWAWQLLSLSCLFVSRSLLQVQLLVLLILLMLQMPQQLRFVVLLSSFSTELWYCLNILQGMFLLHKWPFYSGTSFSIVSLEKFEKSENLTCYVSNVFGS